MAKREGFVPIHNDKTKQVGEVHESTLKAYEARGWKQGSKEYKTSDEKKGG